MPVGIGVSVRLASQELSSSSVIRCFFLALLSNGGPTGSTEDCIFRLEVVIGTALGGAGVSPSTSEGDGVVSRGGGRERTRRVRFCNGNFALSGLSRDGGLGGLGASQASSIASISAARFWRSSVGVWPISHSSAASLPYLRHRDSCASRRNSSFQQSVKWKFGWTIFQMTGVGGRDFKKAPCVATTSGKS